MFYDYKDIEEEIKNAGGNPEYVRELENQVDSLESENSSLKSENSSLESENATLEQTNSTLTTQNNELQAEVERLESELENAGSGGTSVEKGIIIKACNSEGYATDIEIVGLTKIPNHYFFNSGTQNKHALATVVNLTLPDNVTEIGNSAFANNQNLSLDKLPSGLTKLDTSSLATTGVTINELPASLKTIGTYALASCKNITRLDVLAEDFTSFSGNCLNGSGLNELILRTSTPPTLATTSIASTPIASKTGYIYVPDESVDTYKSASVWSNYATQIKGISELPTE